MKYLSFILPIIALISCACVCGGGGPVNPVTPPQADTIANLQYPTNNRLVMLGASNSVLYGVTSGFFPNTGVANRCLPGDGWYSVKYQDDKCADVIIGMKNTATLDGQGSFQVKMWVSGGSIYCGGTSGVTAVTTVAGYPYLRIARTGSTFKAQYSSNNVNWTDIYTFAYTGTDTMYLCAAAAQGKRMYQPKALGTVAYNGGGNGNTVDTLIVCDGNSLTQNGYPPYVDDTIPFNSPKCHVLNLGVGGQTTQQMSADAPWDVDSLYTPGKFNVLVAWEIGNDMGSDATGAYNRFVSYCQARKAAGWTVVVITCPPRSNVNDSLLQAANALLVANWATFADAIVDTRADDRLATINATYWDSDNVHLNAAGNRLIDYMVRRELVNL